MGYPVTTTYLSHSGPRTKSIPCEDSGSPKADLLARQLLLSFRGAHCRDERGHHTISCTDGAGSEAVSFVIFVSVTFLSLGPPNSQSKRGEVYLGGFNLWVASSKAGTGSCKSQQWKGAQSMAPKKQNLWKKLGTRIHPSSGLQPDSPHKGTFTIDSIRE